MNKEEKQLKSTRDQLLAELKECNDRLDAIKAQKDKEAEIKRTYQPNYVEPEYMRDWESYAKALENFLIDLSVVTCDESLQKKIDEALVKMRNEHSFKLPINPSKVWNCPKCGKRDTLFIGTYGTADEFHVKYAVTCDICDFTGPESNDYGEAWAEFKDWLKKEGYLKDGN